MTWLERCRIAKARKKMWIIPHPHFTADEKALAKSWMTCAFGEANAELGFIVPLNFDERRSTLLDYGPPPQDAILHEAGGRFYSAVDADQPEAAEGFLHIIRARLAALYGPLSGRVEDAVLDGLQMNFTLTSESCEMTLKKLEDAAARGHE